MLQINRISKEYVTGDFIQSALDGVSLNLRDNEFVAILGPSGSGKTTLLNIIGGLDRYDTGDLIINGVSTRRYTDRDWDSYRNHTIGFVFQSYNLIPHQSILANVELALTISGVSPKERRQRAIEALEKVGLGDHLHKRPSQLSGGQMQRVAIARALVNNPRILLADEPTGALDTETSIQVMELLKEVAQDRLVVMVTHNPELAEQYATRIVKLRDGIITDDSDPYEVDTKALTPPQHKNMGKSSMSFVTALSLSFHNLRTKLARTLLTAFAGSIGIIGIALILSLSTGVNTYITDIQKDTMTSYPITISAQSMDVSSLLELRSTVVGTTKEVKHKLNGVYSNGRDFEIASTATTSISENNLTSFKEYLDDTSSEIHQYVGENGIVYSYDLNFGVYTYDSEGTFVNTDGSTLEDDAEASNVLLSAMDSSIVAQKIAGSSCFSELLPGKGNALVSPALKDNFDVVYGHWPKDYDEVVLVLDENHEIAAKTLYELGLLPTSEYKDLMKDINDGKEVDLDTVEWDYDEICEQEYYMIPACDTYVRNDDGTFTCIAEDIEALEQLFDDAVKLEIVGVIVPNNEDAATLISGAIGYTRELTDYIIEETDDSEIVRAQKKNKDVNVLTGLAFNPENDDDKIEDARTYVSRLGISDKANMSKKILQAQYKDNTVMLAQVGNMSETQLANRLDTIMRSSDKDTILSIYDNYISVGTYDDNMTEFGVVSLDAPSSISIYVDSFEDKNAISECIEAYNETADDDEQITYTDYVGMLMSSVTTIIDVISYVLIAFVGVSLVVSSIMIGIITYISVLERTKEIGILRAIGASKSNISQVFNAETFIIGLLSGVLGILISGLLLIPGNAIIHSLVGTNDVNAALPVAAAVVLILLSVVLTLIGGFIPAKKAARKDPVTALRTE
ncbi:MAG: ATP-binding cassette domain-containing protein [Faecousia sp.]